MKALGAGLVLVIAAACGSNSTPHLTPQTTAADPLSAWYAAHSLETQTALQTLLSDNQAVASAAGNLDFGATADACRQLGVDLQTALAIPPIPDANAASHFRASLILYQQGAQDCLVGASSSDASLMTRSATEITQATTEMSQATAALPRAHAVTRVGVP